MATDSATDMRAETPSLPSVACHAPISECDADLGILFTDRCPFAVRVGVFADTAGERLLLARTFRGPLPDQWRAATGFLETHTTAILPVPGPAVGEALANAMAHRDYTGFDGPTVVRVHPDRIEVVSLGGAPEGLEIPDLFTGVCAPPNTSVADRLASEGIGHGVGSGIGMITSLYESCDRPPMIATGPHSFRLILPRPSHPIY